MSVDGRMPDAGAAKRERPLVIGLTGPIASGKSTVAALLRERGAAIIDADAVYRSLVTPGSALWSRIGECFGSSILRPNNEIDRTRLGQIVFQNPAALADLERLTHPAVVAEIRRQIAESRAGVVVVEAVKLTQAGLLDDVDSLWLVTAEPEIRLRRLVSRNGFDETRARARMSASSENTYPHARVDVTIENSGDISEASRAVDEAWRRLMERSRREGDVAAVTAERIEESA